jgi:putative lipoic acid-binding regulatory protein
MNQKSQEFYKNLKEKLTTSTDWPSEYLYKFIVPSDTEKIRSIEKAFDNMGAVIKTNQSKTAKYTSVSINVQMKDPDAVIEKYVLISDIEGVISL